MASRLRSVSCWPSLLPPLAARHRLGARKPAGCARREHFHDAQPVGGARSSILTASRATGSEVARICALNGKFGADNLLRSLRWHQLGRLLRGAGQ